MAHPKVILFGIMLTCFLGFGLVISWILLECKPNGLGSAFLAIYFGWIVLFAMQTYGAEIHKREKMLKQHSIQMK
jgi:hypothetical protein